LHDFIGYVMRFGFGGVDMSIKAEIIEIERQAAEIRDIRLELEGELKEIDKKMEVGRWKTN
jgi:hypothetical protein